MNKKRLFDLTFAIFLLLILAPALIVIGILIYFRDGSPVFYLSERMSGTESSFTLIKFRTMNAASENSGVSGGQKVNRITKMGNILRKTRLDETPQLINILKGDMSFIGPRPPLRMYVERFPDVYSRVLSTPPGVSGIASIYYHRTEETLLSNCKSAAETDEVYSRRCIPKKAKLDLLYVNNKSVCFDIKLLVLTVKKVFF